MIMYKYILMLPCNTWKYPFCPESMKNVRSYFGFRQKSSQTKGFMHGLVQKILETYERVANISLHPGANYTYMYHLHIPCVNQRMWTGLKSTWNFKAGPLR